MNAHPPRKSLIMPRALALCAALALTTPAWSLYAQGPAMNDQERTELFRRLIADATKLAYEGRYDEAILKYIEAKTIYDDPLLDYNIARCYHQKGDCNAARRFYQIVIDNQGAAEEDRAQARNYLEELASCQPEPTEPVVVKPDPVNPDPVDPDPVADDGPGAWTVAAWTMTGVGGALVVTGLALDVAGAGLIDEYEQAAEQGDRARFDQLRQDIDGRQTLVFVLYGVGVATAAVGAVMVLMDGGDDEPAVGGGWSPWVTPGGAGAVFEGRF